MSKAIIILPRIRVQNANCISSPLTWGFPSLTAIFGCIHALERKIRVNYPKLSFKKFGVVCHEFYPQTEKAYEHSFKLMRKPLTKEGENQAIVEEGRVHLVVSLIIEAEGESLDIIQEEQDTFAKQCLEQLHTLRFAGGSILPSLSGRKSTPEYVNWSLSYDKKKEKFTELRRKILPGFTLLSRELLLVEHSHNVRTKNEKHNMLDALIDIVSVHHISEKTDEDHVEWSIKKCYPGWLVPISTGYRGISPCYEPGEVEEARDPSIPFQFVENIYSLGEWKSPHRIQSFDDMLWRQEIDIQNSVYRLTNNYVTQEVNNGK